jgi:histone acetyltransferase MCC1
LIQAVSQTKKINARPMNGVAQHRQHDPVVVDHLDWIEAGRNPTTATQWSMLDSLFGSGSSRGTTTRLVPNESSRCASNSTSSAGHKKKRRLRCRMIQPQDREVIQRLHEEWFPVLYQDEFFDELVQGRMIGSGDPLLTRVAVEEDANDNDLPPQERIVGCVVGSFVNANLLSKFMQELLVNDIGTHPRLFYIMTLGCVRRVRRTGLASTMVDEILAAVAQDVSCGVVYLHVKVDNVAAIRMYEKLGFYRVTEIENYYSINETLHNCYLYARYFHGTCIILVSLISFLDLSEYDHFC